jgi:threo-3-hydroxy-L-aspartate ammonia-lyase
MVSFQDIAAAHERLKPHALRTPAVTSTTVDAMIDGTAYFKCENLQRMGAFKFRGAYNALSQLSEDRKKRGVITYSSGNHAQAVALSGKLLGIKAVIVMPEDAPQVKLEATRAYGAEVLRYGKGEAREEVAGKIAAERQLTMIPPFDHEHVIAGQGTAAKELIEDVGPLDLLLVPCGGGGLLSGSAIAAKHLAPKCRVVGVEPEGGNDATQSFVQKRLVTVAAPDTIADGARTPSLGKITFPIVMRYVDDMVTVSDAELARTMFWIWERMKLVVEPTGALAATALLQQKVKAQGLKVGVILSGGNVDLRWAAAQVIKQQDH